MRASSRALDRLLRALPAAKLQLLALYRATIELVRGLVLTEAGATLQYVYLPHSGGVSMMVNLSEGQAVEVAMAGRLQRKRLRSTIG